MRTELQKGFEEAAKPELDGQHTTLISVLLAGDEFLVRFLFAHRHVQLAYFAQQSFRGFLDLHLLDEVLPVVELPSKGVVAFESVEAFENAREVLQMQEAFCIFTQKRKNLDSTLDESALT